MLWSFGILYLLIYKFVVVNIHYGYASPSASLCVLLSEWAQASLSGEREIPVPNSISVWVYPQMEFFW